MFPDDYPTTNCPCGNCQPPSAGWYVPPEGEYPAAKETDFNWMKAGILYTINHQIWSIWSSKQAKEYLKQCGSNKQIHESIEFEWASMVANNIPVGNLTDQIVFMSTLPPALKRNVPIDWYVHATMHLLKGLGEDVLDLMADWTKKY